jgi:hypothetical protein
MKRTSLKTVCTSFALGIVCLSASTPVANAQLTGPFGWPAQHQSAPQYQPMSTQVPAVQPQPALMGSMTYPMTTVDSYQYQPPIPAHNRPSYNQPYYYGVMPATSYVPPSPLQAPQPMVVQEYPAFGFPTQPDLPVQPDLPTQSVLPTQSMSQMQYSAPQLSEFELKETIISEEPVDGVTIGDVKNGEIILDPSRPNFPQQFLQEQIISEEPVEGLQATITEEDEAIVVVEKEADKSNAEPDVDLEMNEDEAPGSILTLDEDLPEEPSVESEPQIQFADADEVSSAEKETLDAEKREKLLRLRDEAVKALEDKLAMEREFHEQQLQGIKAQTAALEAALNAKLQEAKAKAEVINKAADEKANAELKLADERIAKAKKTAKTAETLAAKIAKERDQEVAEAKKAMLQAKNQIRELRAKLAAKESAKPENSKSKSKSSKSESSKTKKDSRSNKRKRSKSKGDHKSHDKDAHKDKRSTEKRSSAEDDAAKKAAAKNEAEAKARKILDTKVAALKKEMERKIEEQEKNIRKKGESKIAALLKKGKSENSDEVHQAKQEMEKSLKLGKRKIRARYERKIRRLKRDFEAKKKS